MLGGHFYLYIYLFIYFETIRFYCLERERILYLAADLSSLGLRFLRKKLIYSEKLLYIWLLHIESYMPLYEFIRT